MATPSIIVLPGNRDITITVSSVMKARGPGSLIKFKADKEKLKKNSEYFAISLRFNDAHGPHPVELKDDDIGAMRVWLWYLHAMKARKEVAGDDKAVGENKVEDEEDTAEQDALFRHAGIHDTDIRRIWEIITTGDKYLFNASILRGFFKRWYSKNANEDAFIRDPEFAREVALPCYMFDYAEGFAEVTKWLAYNNAGHIKEKRPAGFKWKHMHLCPPDFVGPMNHARGGLKSSLHKDSVNALLSRLGRFKVGKTGACKACDIDWTKHVIAAKNITERYFDGLCMDYMDKSRPPRGKDADELYWTHLQSTNGRWNTDCRIKHGEPSWYVSWCGRDEHRQKLLTNHREEKRNHELHFGFRDDGV